MNAKMKKLADDAFNNHRVYGKLMSPYEHDIWRDGFETRDKIAQEREARLVEALEFYANTSNYELGKPGKRNSANLSFAGNKSSEWFTPDHGARARRALTNYKAEGE